MAMWIGPEVWGSQGPRGPSPAETNFYDFPKVRHSEPPPPSSQIKILNAVGPRVAVLALQMLPPSGSEPKRERKYFLGIPGLSDTSISPQRMMGERGTHGWNANLPALFCCPHLLLVGLWWRASFRGRSGHQALLGRKQVITSFCFSFSEPPLFRPVRSYKRQWPILGSVLVSHTSGTSRSGGRDETMCSAFPGPQKPRNWSESPRGSVNPVGSTTCLVPQQWCGWSKHSLEEAFEITASGSS